MIKALGSTPRLLARARENYTLSFPDTAQIFRISEEQQTTAFGVIRQYTLLDIVPANRWGIGGREALIAQRLDVDAEAVVSMPYDVDVTELDEIVYTDTETGRIHHYSITSVGGGSRKQTRNAMVTEYPFLDGHTVSG